MQRRRILGCSYQSTCVLCVITIFRNIYINNWLSQPLRITTCGIMTQALGLPGSPLSFLPLASWLLQFVLATWEFQLHSSNHVSSLFQVFFCIFREAYFTTYVFFLGFSSQAPFCYSEVSISPWSSFAACMSATWDWFWQPMVGHCPVTDTYILCRRWFRIEGRIYGGCLCRLWEFRCYLMAS